MNWCKLVSSLHTGRSLKPKRLPGLSADYLSCPLLPSGFSLILLLAAAEALLGGVCEWFLEMIVEMYVPPR